MLPVSKGLEAEYMLGLQLFFVAIPSSTSPFYSIFITELSIFTTYKISGIPASCGNNCRNWSLQESNNWAYFF